MTETRKWTVGAAVVAVAILVAGWFLLIAPKRAEVSELEGQVVSQEAANSQAQTQLAVLKQQNKDLPEKQAELAALQTQIPLSPDLPTYIREMQDIGAQAGVDVVSMTPAPAVNLGSTAETAEQSLTPGVLAAINVEMVVTGGYFEITRYVNELESASRYTWRGRLTIDEVTADTRKETIGPDGDRQCADLHGARGPGRGGWDGAGPSRDHSGPRTHPHVGTGVLGDRDVRDTHAREPHAR